MELDRHAFVRLKAPPDADPCGGTRAEIQAWHEAGRPFVVASRRASDETSTLRLGLATPDKRRIAFRVRANAVASVLSPPSLAEARRAAPISWQAVMSQVVEICTASGIPVSIFGSLAWSVTSGMSFLNAHSDIDLLLSSAGLDSKQLQVSIARLFAFDDAVPLIDGELVLPGGGAVNLREFLARPAEILVKAHGGATLVPFELIDTRIAQARTA